MYRKFEFVDCVFLYLTDNKHKNSVKECNKITFHRNRGIHYLNIFLNTYIYIYIVQNNRAFDVAKNEQI